MVGYYGDAERNAEAMADGVYHTGDVGSRDADGYITYVGRADDVFKASDYRISPFELESVLIEHPAVAEAADRAVAGPGAAGRPKAYVVLAAGHEPDEETARSILEFAREQPRALQADPPAGVRRAAEDDLREDPAGGAAGPRERAARRRVGNAVRRVHPVAAPAGGARKVSGRAR